MHAAYIAAAVPEVADIHPTKMRIEHDGGVIEGEFMFGAVSNSLSVGGFFKIPKEQVKFNDGVFEVLLVPKIKMTRLFHVLHKVRSQNYDGKEIIFFKTSKIKIYAPDEDVPWTLDGEFGGNHHNVSIHVLERAVEIYSPENPLFLPRREVVTDPIEVEARKKGENRFFRRRNKAEKAAEPVQEPAAEEAATVPTQEAEEKGDPKAEEIKAEIGRLRTDGIDKKLFSAVKSAAYGNMVRKFNSVENLATQLTECAMCDYDLFEEIKLIKTASYDDVMKRLDVFCNENAVLSVIKPLEE